jgi:hypothetical protein
MSWISRASATSPASSGNFMVPPAISNGQHFLHTCTTVLSKHNCSYFQFSIWQEADIPITSRACTCLASSQRLRYSVIQRSSRVYTIARVNMFMFFCYILVKKMDSCTFASLSYDYQVPNVEINKLLRLI